MPSSFISTEPFLELSETMRCCLRIWLNWGILGGSIIKMEQPSHVYGALNWFLCRHPTKFWNSAYVLFGHMAGSLWTVQNWMALPCTTNAKLGHFAIQECLFIVGLMPWSKEMSEDPRERADAEKAMKCEILLRTCDHVENVYLKITEHQSPVQVKSPQQQSSKWLKRTVWQEWMSTLILLHKAQRGDLGKKYKRKPQLSKRTLSSVSNGWCQNVWQKQITEFQQKHLIPVT